MSSDTDGGAWRVTTDREQITEWAEDRGAVPVRDDAADGDGEIRLSTEPADVTGERLSWDEFFERFEAEWLAFRYREGATTDDAQPAYEFVDREEMTADQSEDRAPPDYEQASTHQNAWSDTGEDEPAPAETAVSGDAAGGGEAAARDNKDVSGERVDLDDTDRDEDTPMSESSRGAELDAFVLDEIHEERGLTSDVNDEYLTFENTADEPLELSGWTVENEDGQSYAFPEGFVLDAGDSVTLHSGEGADSETDLYWGATDPVWDDDGDTVTVTTADGRQVVREPYRE